MNAVWMLHLVNVSVYKNSDQMNAITWLTQTYNAYECYHIYTFWYRDNFNDLLTNIGFISSLWWNDWWHITQCTPNQTQPMSTKRSQRTGRSFCTITPISFIRLILLRWVTMSIKGFILYICAKRNLISTIFASYTQTGYGSGRSWG